MSGYARSALINCVNIRSSYFVVENLLFGSVTQEKCKYADEQQTQFINAQN